MTTTTIFSTNRGSRAVHPGDAESNPASGGETMFRLVRYFSLTSAVAIIAVILGLVMHYRAGEVDKLVDFGESQNVALAQSFANTFWPRFAPYVTSVSGLDGDALRARPETREIYEVARTLTARLPVVKIKIYNMDGLTVFSSHENNIGTIKSNNPKFFSAARHGKPASKLVHKDTFNTFSGEILDRDLVETYLPIRQGDGPIEAVFEFYSDVTPQVAKIKVAANRLLAGLVLAFALLYGTLYLIVRRADRILQRQHAALRRSEKETSAKNTALEHQIVEREWTEEALQQANERLEQRVVERTHNLTREIAERKNVEDALRQSEARFREAIEHLQEGFALYGPDDRLVLCNDEYRRLHPETEDILKPGMPFEQLVRTNIERGVNADAVGREEEHIRERIDQHRNPKGPIVRRLGDGTWFIIKENRTPDGGIVVTETDVTELKRAEQALRESRERFRAVVDNSPTKIHIKDLDGRYLLVNRQSEILFGTTEEEAMGKTSRDIFPKAVADSFMGHDQRVIDTGQTIEEEEEWRYDDGIRTYLTVKFPIAGADGQTAAVGAIGTDITERKKAEAEIRHLNATLEERVARRTADLEAANKELEAFSYSVSHDLRGPLRTVDGFSRILLEEYTDKLDDQARSYLERVRAGSQKMGQLIDAILTLSRLTRNELNRSKLDLSGVVNVIVHELREANLDRDLTFEVSPGVTAVGDEQLLRVALENLLGNAVKYTGHKKQAKVEFGASNGDGRVVYYVRDNGAGFDMTYAHKLFAPFQRVHGPKEFEGTGIGLATVKRIINRHSGDVWAEAEIDKGATFYFTL